MIDGQTFQAAMEQLKAQEHTELARTFMHCFDLACMYERTIKQVAEDLYWLEVSSQEANTRHGLAVAIVNLNEVLHRLERQEAMQADVTARTSQDNQGEVKP